MGTDICQPASPGATTIITMDQLRDLRTITSIREIPRVLCKPVTPRSNKITKDLDKPVTQSNNKITRDLDKQATPRSNNKITRDLCETSPPRTGNTKTTRPHSQPNRTGLL